jgi:ABC-type multidrug transport system fused ATPase/permease subunit
LLAHFAADRIALLKRLRSAGPGLLSGLILLTVAASLVPAATALAFAALIGRVAYGDGLAGVAVTTLLAYLAVLLLGHVFGAVREPLSYLARMRIDGEYRAEVSRLAATSATIGALERADVQVLIRQARADPESFMDGSPGPGALAQLDVLGRIVAIAGSGAVLAAYAWWLVPLLALPAAALNGLAQLAGRDWRRVWRGVLLPSMRADVWADALVSPGEGKEIRIFGLGGWAVDRIQLEMRTAFDPMWAVGRRVLARQGWQLPLVAGPLAVAYLAVTADAAGGEVPVSVAAAVFAAAMTVFPVDAHQAHLTINALTCLRAFDRLRGELTEVPAATGRAVPLVRFERVGFAYPGTTRPVLDGLDLEIRPGELLGLVGLNGAGKSTLIKLLACLYEPTAGRVTADGADLATIGPEAWRKRISIVFQDFVRYHLSAADNVALGNATMPRDEPALAAAARDAGLDEVLARLPHGWDTPLARSRTGGVDLSGGQWQQVVLARALYAVRTGAQLLVLDEPTAHLDVRTEFDVFGRLAAHRGDATVVLISHRLSTVRRADRIVLLDGGRIAEAGTHDELMALGGRYAAMFTIQAERFAEEES